MRKYIYLLAAAILCLSFVTKKQKYTSTNLKRRVILDIPVGFNRLSEEDVVVKYGMDMAPLGVFEDETGEVSISITEKIDSLRNTKISYKTQDQIRSVSRDLAIEKSFLIASYRSYYDQLTILTDTVKEINGVPMALVEYESKLSGNNNKEEHVTTEQYNYIAYGYRRNRNYIINISFPSYKKKELQKIATHIISTIKF